MKRTEIATIVLVMGVSGIAMFVIAQSLLADKFKRSVQIEQAISLSEEIEPPKKRVFNGDAINPTVEVCVETVSVEAGDTGGDCLKTTSEAPASDTSEEDANASAASDTQAANSASEPSQSQLDNKDADSR